MHPSTRASDRYRAASATQALEKLWLYRTPFHPFPFLLCFRPRLSVIPRTPCGAMHRILFLTLLFFFLFFLGSGTCSVQSQGRVVDGVDG